MTMLIASGATLSQIAATFYAGPAYRLVGLAAPSQPPPHERLIQSFVTLSPGWDGYDAEPPSPIAAETATRIAQTFAESQVHLDRIAPSAVGGIGITIRGDKSRKAYIEVYNDATVYMMLTCPTDEDPDVSPVRAAGERERAAIVNQVRKYLGV